MQYASAILLQAAFVFATVNSLPSIDTQLAVSEYGPKLEWWQNAVFYQIYPRSFADSNGDGIGDIRGIIKKLNYLEDLGVNAAWLSPIFKSPMADFGYDISNFYDVDPIFGNIADLEELFEEANKRNLKIILDFVPNHSSDECEWFQKSIDRIEPYTDYYVWHDGKKNGTIMEPPNNWQSIFYGSAWTWNNQRKQYYYHQFHEKQPDLNYRNPKVVEEMLNVLRFWLKKGVAGFRIDAVNHMFEDAKFRDEPLTNKTNDPKSHEYTHHIYTKDLPEMYEMVYKFRELADNFQTEFGGDRRVLMTEAYTNDTEYPKYFKSADGKKKGSQVPFNFILIEQLNRTSTASDFKIVIDKRFGAVPNETRLNWVIGNHDQPRVGSRFGAERIDGLLTLVMTLPGIAVTYNGEEIGMLDNREGISYKDTMDPQACNLNETDNWRELSRDPERTPFQWDDSEYAGFILKKSETIKPWLPIHPNYRDINVKNQEKAKRSTLKFYKDLLEIRKHDTFAYGSFNSTVINGNVFAYARTLDEHDTFIVLINFGAREELIDITALSADFSEKSEVVAASVESCYTTGQKLDSDSILLGKYYAIILKPSHWQSTPSSGPLTNIISTIGLLVIPIIGFIL